jgi:hypothetical protein
MDAIYELKDMLCEELEEYGKKDKLDVGGLEIVDKLAHTVKNLDKIIEAYEEQGYSGDYDNMGDSYDGSYGRRYSRERGYSRARGRNAKRDSMGRYSRDGKMMARELRELMEDAPDESIKTEMRRLIQKVESM